MLRISRAGRLWLMKSTYAVNWEEEPGVTGAGKLELWPRSLVLEGLGNGRPRMSEISYRDISAVRIARTYSDRLGGRPTLIIDLRSGSHLRIASVAQSGIVSELAEHLAAVHLGEEPRVSRVVVVIPLKPGVYDRASSLVRGGPPFDPQEAGLERHHVFLTEHEAVFVFEGSTPEAIERLVQDANVWIAASAWTEIVAGPPRVAEDVYDWVRPEPLENLSYAPTPGPGDSDGGDLFRPDGD
jgi:hypothetical protein